MTQALLVLNTGSSSLKFRLFALAPGLPLLAGGKVEDIGLDARFKADDGQEAAQLQPVAAPDHQAALQVALEWLEQRQNGWTLVAAAHRIVHGGDRFAGPTRLDQEALDYLHGLCHLAPLHQAHNLAGVATLAARRPDLVQYGCFDTAFHARHQPLFQRYALPLWLHQKGVRRYGFHGLSFDWIAHCLKQDHPQLADARVVAAHLGNGASLCAINQGQSVDTTMGLTALSGLPMGTRCGDLDPGAVLYMQRELGMSLAETEHLLYQESGLKGLSGLTNDVKTLLRDHSDAARFALDYFALKVAQQVAAMAVSIGGLDALVFTGGIGENARPVRKAILARLAFLGPFPSLVIPANEERCMAMEIQESFYAGSA
ncbi:acetate/propionate family kinase [Gallaecimonas kandeliae]|uniref:acetate/propionate family kinase n=1 Tax=Gallaecimonas kandeliae TaxID=3029055 RepID=UPI002647649D|nr:acetate/propionate family kinase [Gallaecimonas kandeliae]WKE66642.1 acetate/propionate family kinase [Gallaecimonas kandeliae]